MELCAHCERDAGVKTCIFCGKLTCTNCEQEEDCDYA